MVFSYLRKHKIYFQRHYKKASGNPDIALPSKKKAVFIDGDFWHGRNFSQLKKRLPSKFWLDKIDGNAKRDKKNRATLRRKEWKVLRIWGNDLKLVSTREQQLERIVEFLMDSTK